MPKPIYEEEDEEDEEAKLIRQLQEYKLYKMACEQLRENEENAGLRYYRLPEEVADRTELDLEGVDISALKNAFQELLQRIEEINRETPPQEIERETFSVQEKIFVIKQRLLKKRKTTFKELFEDSTTKIEVIITFMALLELSKLGRVKVSQTKNKDNIIIEALGDPEGIEEENERN